MKKKLVSIILLGCMALSLVACGGTTKESSEVAGSNSNVSDVNSENANTGNDKVENSEPAETEKGPVITTIKEEDAVIDFDGIKVPMSITWAEFKKLMEDNEWTFVDSEKEFPSGDKLAGSGYINTNCGKVYIKFNSNEDGTKSVLMSVTAYYSQASEEKISIGEINGKTPIETLKLYLTNVEGKEKAFHLDTYLIVELGSNNFTIKRTFYSLR